MSLASVRRILACFFIALAGSSAWGDATGDHQILWTIDFDGNTSVKGDELLDAIASMPSSHFLALTGFVFGGRHELDPLVLRDDRKRIEHLYQRKGYFEARVREALVQPCSHEGRVCVHLKIDEGQPTLLSGVDIRMHEGHPQRTSAEMAEVLGMRVGEVFDHDRYLAQKSTIVRYLKERGYPLPVVTGDAAYAPKTNSVALAIDVTPGWSSTLGFISFDGLERIRPDDLEARLPLKTGMAYDPKIFDDSQDLLSGLDVFRTVDPKLTPRATEPDVVDVRYAVHEKPLKTFQFGGGIQIENARQELKLTGEWTNRNFFDHLRTFDVKIEPRYAVLPSIFNVQEAGPLGDAEVSVKQPGFLSPWQDLRTAIGFDSDLEQGYSWYGPRFTTTIDRHLAHTLTLSYGYSFKYLTFYDVNLTQTGAPTSGAVPIELLFAQNYRLGYLSEFLRWDFRDDLIEPHRGFYAQLGLQESSQVLASAFTYVRLTPELRHYFPLTKRATFAAKAYYGRIVPLIGRTTPITERYYGGGANDHRGFSYHRLSPQVQTANGETEPVGGNEEVLFSGELRVELFQLAGHWMIGALFADFGDVVESPSGFDWGALHCAVGPGLRYNTALGMIRGDVGFRLNRLSAMTDGRPNPDPGQLYAIHVSFGESF